tara:strand:- start:483 stop:1145 length:663 start_codon:yes stop_codon:yes gene_type:complete
MAVKFSQTIHQFISSKAPIIVEAGANNGQDTQRILSQFKKVKMHCFEPDPRCIAKFRGRISDNRVRLYEAAVSDRDGEAVFHLSTGRRPRDRPGRKPDQINSSSLLPPKKHLRKFPWIKFEETITVKTVKLDSWAKKHLDDDNIIDFLWADVQGAEEKMITGGIETLQRTRFFYTEVGTIELYKGQMTHKPLGRLIKNKLPTFKRVTNFGNNWLLKNQAI